MYTLYVCTHCKYDFITALAPLNLMDTNIRQLIWNGAIPLEIHINDPETILNTYSGTLNLPFYVIKLLQFVYYNPIVLFVHPSICR